MPVFCNLQKLQNLFNEIYTFKHGPFCFLLYRRLAVLRNLMKFDFSFTQRKKYSVRRTMCGIYLSEQPTVTRLVKKLPAFYEIQKCVQFFPRFKICSSNILRYERKSPKQTLLFRFSQLKLCMHLSFPQHVITVPPI